MPTPSDSFGSIDLLGVEALLTDEERAIQATIQRFVDDHVLSETDAWYEQGRFPIKLAPEFGKLGLPIPSVTLDYAVMRHMQNLESVLTYEGTSEIHTLVLGHALTGHSAYR